MTEDQLKKNNARHDRIEMLRVMRKKLMMRGLLVIATVLLAGVLLFTLTAAWYTNIVGTDGLSFTAKQWNFDGTISIDGETVSAVPGDHGIIPMTISNQGSEMATVSVTASKAGFDSAQMQQRIYFYVDAPLYRNGERMERVYVNAYNSYNYTLFPQSELVINETAQDSYPLKWEWVYDVLGYYVMGRLDSISGVVSVEEYMSPIEYEYDMFATTFDASGRLLTVDGTKTADQLLSEISAADGYAGTISPDNRSANGFYRVSVNSEGYGVWAYLCTYDEIKANAEYDTRVGNGEIVPQCPVTVSVTGSNSNGGAVEVADAERLTSILSTSTYASVKLTENITIAGQIDLPEGSRVQVDLNGKTLTSTAATVFSATEGSKLTVNGGSDPSNPGRIVGKGGTHTYAVFATGAQVEVNNVRISGVDAGIRIEDQNSTNKTNSMVRISDSTIDGERFGLWVFGNDGDAGTSTTVVVERCNLFGRGYAGINCNGTYPNVNITINDTYIEGLYTGIYHPQLDSTLTLENCTVIGTGGNGIVVKGGVVNIANSRIIGQGNYNPDKVYTNGFGINGAGITIEASYDGNIAVNISGDTVVSSEKSYAIRLLKAENYAYTADFNITGGTYTSVRTATYKDGETDVTVELNGSVAAYLASGLKETAVPDELGNKVSYTVSSTEG